MLNEMEILKLYQTQNTTIYIYIKKMFHYPYKNRCKFILFIVSSYCVNHKNFLKPIINLLKPIIIL